MSFTFARFDHLALRNFTLCEDVLRSYHLLSLLLPLFMLVT